MKIISAILKLLFFRSTDLYTVYLFLEYAGNYNIINFARYYSKHL